MIKMSNTQMNNYLLCNYKHYLSGIEYIRPKITPDQLRAGSNWHDLHEIIGSSNLDTEADDYYEKVMELLTEKLNIAYAKVPYYKEATEWEIERNVLLYAIAAYLALPIRNFGAKILDTDIMFRIPVIDPSTGKEIDDGILTGKLDEFSVLPDGTFVVPDYKSTSSDVSDDSNLWVELGQTAQTKFYVYVLQRLQKSGELLKYGLKPSDRLIRSAFYSVWKKPSIKPKMLKQTDSAEFLETGMYYDQEFEVTYADGTNTAVVDGAIVEAKPGKKAGTFALKESPVMYALRLYKDMIDNPDKYFNAKTFNYTDKQIKEFEVELFETYRSMKLAREHNCFPRSREQCRPRAGFECPYTAICDNNVDISKGLPDGLVRNK